MAYISLKRQKETLKIGSVDRLAAVSYESLNSVSSDEGESDLKRDSRRSSKAILPTVTEEVQKKKKK